MRTILKGAFLTILTLFGGLLIGLVAGDIVSRLIPGSSINNVKLGHAAIAALPALAVSLFWRVGLAAAVTFLLVNLVMESLGWVVGAPGAAERATMITVLAAGNLGAALVGGSVLGLILYNYKEHTIHA